MPRAGRQTLTHRPPIATRATLVLRWSLSRPAAAAATLVEDQAGPAPALEVRLPWGGACAGRVSARLIDGDRTERLALEAAAGGAWTLDDATGLRHLDLPGLLRITARAAAKGVEVLYARTELLAGLGLPGGRYDLQSASLSLDAD
jgi:hypothetical protein